MKICSMVIDHLDWVNYRVEYISGRLQLFDLVIWFGANEEQCSFLEKKKLSCEHLNVEIVNINHRIGDGSDFTIMQDKSFEYIKANYDYSICAFLSADEFPTEYGIAAISEWIENSEEQYAVFTAMSNKMFCETFIASLVFQIFRKGVVYRSNNGLSDNLRFCDEKAITDNMYHNNLGESSRENYNYVIDTGYLNVEACYTKVKNWSRLCYGDGHTPRLLSLYNQEDKTEFIKFFIERHRGEFHGATDHKITPVKYEGEYKRLIDDLGMKDEYDFVVSVIDQINTEQK